VAFVPCRQSGARRLSVERLSPFYGSAEVSTTIPLRGSYTNGTLRLAANPYGDFCVWDGRYRLRTPVALRTRGDPTAEDRARYSAVKAQWGAHRMSMAPMYVIVDIHNLKRAFRGSARPPVKSVVHSSASPSTNLIFYAFTSHKYRQHLSNSKPKQDVFIPHHQ